MGEGGSIMSDLLFLCLAAVSVACILAACLFKKQRFSIPALAASVLVISVLYVVLDAYVTVIVHLAAFGGSVLMFALSGEKEQSGKKNQLLVSLIVSAAVFTVLLYVSFSFPWDVFYEPAADGLASIPMVGDSLATLWILVLEAASLIVVSALLGGFLFLRRGEE